MHHTAYCKACTLANDRKSGTVTGKAESMKPHLIQCNHVTEEVRKWAREWTKDSPPFVGSDSSSSQQQSRQQSNLGKFMNLKDAPMTAEEQQQFDMLLLKGTVSANLPFTWIDNEYIQEAFKVARPEVQLPSRRQLAGMLLCFCHLQAASVFHTAAHVFYTAVFYTVKWAAGPLLKDAVTTIQSNFSEGMSKAKQGVTATFDSWTDVSHNQLMAVTVTTSDEPRKVLVLHLGSVTLHLVKTTCVGLHELAVMQIFTKKTINITSSPKTGQKTFEHMKEEIEELQSYYKVLVICVVSDAAGEAAKARRLLREWKPSLLTLDCYSHQFNLSVGGLQTTPAHLSTACSLKVVCDKADADADYLSPKKAKHIYVDVVAEAVEFVTWWIRHSVPYGMLKEKQIAMDGKPTALMLPVVTRWGSHYVAIKQLLKTEFVMKLLALEKRADLINSVGQKKPAKEKAEKMLDLATNSTFWNTLKVVLEHLGPLLVSLPSPCNVLPCIAKWTALHRTAVHCTIVFYSSITVSLSHYCVIPCRLLSGRWSQSRLGWTRLSR